MPYGSVPLHFEGNAPVLTTNNTPHRFVRLHTPRSGPLSGRYCFPDMTGCLTFTSNAQFKDEGAGLILEHALYPYPLSPDRGPETRIGYPGTPDSAAAQDPAELWLSFNLDVLKRMSRLCAARGKPLS